MGLTEGKLTNFPIKRMPDMVDIANRRPLEQWWLDLRSVMQAMAQP
jgi:hypothetical protein